MVRSSCPAHGAHASDSTAVAPAGSRAAAACRGCSWSGRWALASSLQLAVPCGRYSCVLSLPVLQTCAQKKFLGLVQSAPCRVDVVFKDAEGKPYKKNVTVKAAKSDATEELPLYTNHEDVIGEVRLTPLLGKPLEHSGIKVQLIGQIELATERGNPHTFVSLGKHADPQSCPVAPPLFVC
eukprot:355021-Chlamydomonas_euryale.AAC.18